MLKIGIPKGSHGGEGWYVSEVTFSSSSDQGNVLHLTKPSQFLCADSVSLCKNHSPRVSHLNLCLMVHF